MAKVKATNSSSNSRPALTPEARENQMIALAENLAEQQLRDGTASSQVITHYLKLGSSKERIEKEILKKQEALITAKTESLQSTKRIESLYAEAIKAIRRYNGHREPEGDEEYGGC